jgi:hypothetical protein
MPWPDRPCHSRRASPRLLLQRPMGRGKFFYYLHLSHEKTQLTLNSTSLARSGHTVTVVGGRAYIFGGQLGDGKLASNDIHSINLSGQGKAEVEYQLIPALPMTVAQEGDVPQPRTGHAACALTTPNTLSDKTTDSTTYVAVYGGADESGKPVQDNAIWLFDPLEARWACSVPEASTALPLHRGDAKIFAHGADVILYGGKVSGGLPLTDVWRYHTLLRTWSRLPDAPVSTSSAAYFGDSLYLISGTDNVGSSIHFLNCAGLPQEEPSWETIAFPTNPLVPGPRPREYGGLLHITTSYGRNYLLYFFGDLSTSSEEKSEATQWSDMWTFQLPSSDVEVEASTNPSKAVKAAKIKDWIRSKLGAESGEHTWAEVEVKPPGDLPSTQGKVHPGPRSSFGCDVSTDGKSVVIWGGQNAKGETEGDGWVVRLE